MNAVDWAGSAGSAGSWVGSHALWLLAALGGLTAGLTAFGARALGIGAAAGVAGHAVPAALRHRRRIALVAAVVIGSGMFLWLAAELGEAQGLTRFDLSLSEAWRGVAPDAVLVAAEGLTHLGDSRTTLVIGALVTAVLLWRRHWVLAAGWVVALGGRAWINETLKLRFGRQRPILPEGADAFAGLSFPSGHSSGAVLLYGMLAYLALCLLAPRWHRAALLAAVGVALTVAASRVLIGAHFASDVAAGLALGTAWLAACVLVIDAVRCQPAAAGTRMT